jgi:hypothetical protein
MSDPDFSLSECKQNGDTYAHTLKEVKEKQMDMRRDVIVYPQGGKTAV